MNTLKALNRDRGVTIVMVTHEPDIARYADRTVTMRDGRIISDARRSSTEPSGGVIPSAPSGAGSGPAIPLHSALGFGRMVSAAAVQALKSDQYRQNAQNDIEPLARVSFDSFDVVHDAVHDSLKYSATRIAHVKIAG